jgi:hypothetical protein
MNDELKITLLKQSNDTEILEVFTQAFLNDPNLPIIHDKPEFTRNIIKNLMIMYGGIDNTLRHGLILNDKLVCASFSVSTKINPLILLVQSLSLYSSASDFKGIGCRCLKEYFATRLKMPKYKDHYLELLLFGTLPDYQKRGYGEKMIRFLYKEAEERNYKGLVGFTRPDKPAFINLYRRHGWFIDKKFYIRNIKFAWIRIKI